MQSYIASLLFSPTDYVIFFPAPDLKIIHAPALPSGPPAAPATTPPPAPASIFGPPPALVTTPSWSLLHNATIEREGPSGRAVKDYLGNILVLKNVKNYQNIIPTF